MHGCISEGTCAVATPAIQVFVPAVAELLCHSRCCSVNTPTTHSYLHNYGSCTHSSLMLIKLVICMLCSRPPTPHHTTLSHQVIAGQESTDSLRDVIVMLRNTSNPQVEYIVRTVQKWCKMSGLNIV